MAKILTTSNAENTIREAYRPGFEEGLWRNGELLPLLEKRPSFGDTSWRWKVHTTGNDSVEIFSEGEAQPIAGVQVFENAAVAFNYFRVMVHVTGHAKDALKSRWIDHIDAEATMAQTDLLDLMTTSFMGSTYGLELAVDYGDAYAGITRNGSAAYFEPTETAVDDKVTTDDLIDLQETCRDADKASKGPAIWLMSLAQESNIYRLQGNHVITNNNPADKAPGLTRQTFNGDPVVPLRDWSSTVIMRLDMTPGKNQIIEHRPFSVLEMGPSGDSAGIYQFSWAGCFADHNPRFDGKLTGCTA